MSVERLFHWKCDEPGCTTEVVEKHDYGLPPGWKWDTVGSLNHGQRIVHFCPSCLKKRSEKTTITA